MDTSRFESVPVVRVVREAGKPARPIPVPFGVRARAVLGPVGRVARDAAGVAVGLWPLTAVLLMGVLLLLMAGHGSVT
jgi:hypothetical protein